MTNFGLTNLGLLVWPGVLPDYRGISCGFNGLFPKTSKKFSIFALSQGSGGRSELN
jgi:hypothetical protein